ncbi:[formate-C-acetyltransferase]-activating enzyme [Clostridium folliculivorans]|uniref:[formate-C-acetyltransferase]-activating enzyme n=1 Tax=Clostridium folliculivorans TaxID=2886038 RepID=A0A9W5Y4J0_9CLOT|nr:[formate-C-acetyltransferase]-activating enzyme [Clostridium folliculivorans]GKU26589.1 [formate-C-acetyltransferase]-activating enzyme [Clostridium folliculivorans]GKU28979.1 [formate-C-acetyltransferase]-activating enzyme [Clostridium folliculivorans]
MEKAIIFNIQRYSLHDGGGIRTVVFFKGCPLKCPWCSNPESQKFKLEIMRKPNLCIKCSSESCAKCTMSPDKCPTGALDYIGREYTVEEVVNEVKKDIVFYDTSEGGVTLSGGEVLAQPMFALDLLKRLREFSINTAIETSGQGDTEKLLELAKYLDLILFDLKIMDKEKAKDILGADINLIKNNMKELVLNNHKVIPRIPLIPGYTMEDENISEIIAFVKELGLKEIHILPFHQYGSKKYEYLGKDYSLLDIKPPSEEEVNAIKLKMEQEGLTVFIGGR